MSPIGLEGEALLISVVDRSSRLTRPPMDAIVSGVINISHSMRHPLFCHRQLGVATKNPARPCDFGSLSGNSHSALPNFLVLF